MTMRVAGIIVGVIALRTVAIAQAPGAVQPLASRYIDQAGGLTLEDAIAQALKQEPSLRGARTDIDAARGLRLQAGLRPNPSASFSQQTEPAGTDSQTRVEVQWPLDLFRKPGRIEVAERQIAATEQTIADRER